MKAQWVQEVSDCQAVSWLPPANLFCCLIPCLLFSNIYELGDLHKNLYFSFSYHTGELAKLGPHMTSLKTEFLFLPLDRVSILHLATDPTIPYCIQHWGEGSVAIYHCLAVLFSLDTEIFLWTNASVIYGKWKIQRPARPCCSQPVLLLYGICGAPLASGFATPDLYHTLLASPFFTFLALASSYTVTCPNGPFSLDRSKGLL